MFLFLFWCCFVTLCYNITFCFDLIIYLLPFTPISIFQWWSWSWSYSLELLLEHGSYSWTKLKLKELLLFCSSFVPTSTWFFLKLVFPPFIFASCKCGCLGSILLKFFLFDLIDKSLPYFFNLFFLFIYLFVCFALFEYLLTCYYYFWWMFSCLVFMFFMFIIIIYLFHFGFVFIVYLLIDYIFICCVLLFMSWIFALAS